MSPNLTILKIYMALARLHCKDKRNETIDGKNKFVQLCKEQYIELYFCSSNRKYKIMVIQGEVNEYMNKKFKKRVVLCS